MLLSIKKDKKMPKKYHQQHVAVGVCLVFGVLTEKTIFSAVSLEKAWNIPPNNYMVLNEKHNFS